MPSIHSLTEPVQGLAGKAKTIAEAGSLSGCAVQGLAGKAVVMIGKQASRLPGMKSLSVQSAPQGQQQRQSDEFKDTQEHLSRPSGSSDASGKYYDAPEAPQRWVGVSIEMSRCWPGDQAQ